MKRVEKQFSLKKGNFSDKNFIFIFTQHQVSKESANLYADTPDLEIWTAILNSFPF